MFLGERPEISNFLYMGFSATSPPQELSIFSLLTLHMTSILILRFPLPWLSFFVGAVLPFLHVFCACAVLPLYLSVICILALLLWGLTCI